MVTADIPLAAEVIAKGGDAVNPRGERYSADTIHGVLGMRDFMDTMRASGQVGTQAWPLEQTVTSAGNKHPVRRSEHHFKLAIAVGVFKA